MTHAQEHPLLTLARRSIEYGVQHGCAMPAAETGPALSDPALTAHGACFVTLNLHGELRGCIGTLQAYRPLVQDVVDNAFKSAFHDPRFSPVSRPELTALEIHLSLLSPSEPIGFRNEQELLQQLRPGIDGVVLQDGRHRATFLPQVWESLPEPAAFIAQLKHKAGLPAHYWSDTLTVRRYTVESIG